MAKAEKGQWVTVKGRHVFIREGESATDALNRSIAEENETKKQEQIAKNKEQSDKLNGKDEKLPAFSESSLEERKRHLQAFKESLDSRFKHYEHGDYDIYNVGGNFAAYKFRGLSDEHLMKWRSTADSLVTTEKSLKGLRESLDKTIAALSKQKK